MTGSHLLASRLELDFRSPFTHLFGSKKSINYVNKALTSTDSTHQNLYRLSDSFWLSENRLKTVSSAHFSAVFHRQPSGSCSAVNYRYGCDRPHHIVSPIIHELGTGSDNGAVSAVTERIQSVTLFTSVAQGLNAGLQLRRSRVRIPGAPVGRG